MVKKKNEGKKLNINAKMENPIPNEIKVLFGKFYAFSLVYITFFLIINPFMLLKRITDISYLLIILVLGLFYVYMIADVYKKKKGYNSTVYVMFIILVFASISFSIVKFFI